MKNVFKFWEKRILGKLQDSKLYMKKVDQK